MVCCLSRGGPRRAPSRAGLCVTASLFPADSTPLLIIVETKEIGLNHESIVSREFYTSFTRLIRHFGNHFLVNGFYLWQDVSSQSKLLAIFASLCVCIVIGQVQCYRRIGKRNKLTRFTRIWGFLGLNNSNMHITVNVVIICTLSSIEIRQCSK